MAPVVHELAQHEQGRRCLTASSFGLRTGTDGADPGLPGGQAVPNTKAFIASTPRVMPPSPWMTA